MRFAKVLLMLILPAALCAQDSLANGSARASRDPGSLDALRRGIPLDQESRPLPMQRVENSDMRRKRAFPEQPPTIPHAIEGYQLDKNSNQCLRCHSRASADTFQAPMVSVTHFVNREGQVLASISARRYFCTHCHVVQTNAKPLVENEFRDVDELIGARARARE